MDHLLLMLAVIVFLSIVLRNLVLPVKPKSNPTLPISVNYHFTRRCNASCSFCFHTAKTSHICKLKDIFRGLSALAEAGMRKINFAGGEPFLYPDLLARMLRFCKEDLKLESVSIVTNGSKVSEKFLRQNAAYIDIIAVSCDSFDKETNVRIGRTDQGYDWGNVSKLRQISAWCEKYRIRFKLNTVVCKLNINEDMAANVASLRPFRWKAFQVLVVAGENDSDSRRRNAVDLQITDDEFHNWCRRHEHLGVLVPESNRLMKSSYLILDEYMCFLDKDRDSKSKSILDVGVSEALRQIYWDEAAFYERGGIYDWSSLPEGPMEERQTQTACVDHDLDW